MSTVSMTSFVRSVGEKTEREYVVNFYALSNVVFGRKENSLLAIIVLIWAKLELSLAKIKFSFGDNRTFWGEKEPFFWR